MINVPWKKITKDEQNYARLHGDQFIFLKRLDPEGYELYSDQLGFVLVGD